MAKRNKSSRKARRKANSTPQIEAAKAVVEQDVVDLLPYDDLLLDRARTQWQFGDWESLTKLDLDSMRHHPDRAKLALLAAAGRLQTGKIIEAKKFIRSAQDWGCSEKLLIRILAAGAHNSLGCAAAIAGAQSRALGHFISAVETGAPGGDVDLLSTARISQQYRQLGQAIRRSEAMPSGVLSVATTIHSR
jgi:hypothetical protein